MKKQEKQKKIFSIIALLLCAILVIATLIPALSSFAVAADSVSSLKNKLSGLGGEREKLTAELKEIKGDIDKTTQQKLNLDKQINLAQREIDTLEELIAELSGQIGIKEKELSDAIAKVNHQDEMFAKRVRANYEQGSISYIELLLSSDSYSSFLTNTDIVSTIVEYDKKLLVDLKQMRERVREAKEELEASKIENEEVKATQETKKLELVKKNKESIELLFTLKTDQAEYEKQILEVNKQEKAINAEIDRLIKLSQTKEYVGGTFTWPCPGYSNITSHYGNRDHPTTGVYKLHTGTDIGAPYGANVVAMNSGKVIVAGTSYAYGNYIVIDHGGGISTLYAHGSRLLVSQGATVKKGQSIMAVGSTGYSTGNHLHFEVRKNGVYQNPMNYFS